jgi:hypothetical protein
MRLGLLLFLLVTNFLLKAQATNKQLIYGTWQIEAIALDTTRLPLVSADEFARYVIKSKLKPGKSSKQRENDSTSLALTAAILHAQFHRLEIVIDSNSRWVFNYHVELMGDDRPNIIPMRFAFKTDKKIMLIDEDWREETLNLLELRANELVFDGLSQAIGVKLYFKRLVLE